MPDASTTAVPRRTSPVHPATTRDRQPGPWWWRNEIVKAPTWHPVWMSCPGGHLATVSGTGHPDDHEIAADGAVTPSVECPEPGCGWHVQAVLQDWAPAPSEQREVGA